MKDTILKIENLSKQYRLGTVGSGTISHDLNRWWHKVRGKEDPFLKVGEVNDRATKGSSDYVWALKDINFEVKQGEVLGIIGKNGAGKSTLLKLISRITYPTMGTIELKGKVASLLEVGTGFHPELTGRENIFLNGSILGMTRRDIAAKFDEIVAFSGVEKFLDTPVKHYSSGMYVRLAFAVAAHLEPEILIIDEVLAVGDADFQKKCLGRMKTVSDEGRTVVFVSHNLSAVRSLCNKSVVLSQGRMVFEGSVQDGIANYMKSSVENANSLSWIPSKQIARNGVELSKIFVTPEANKSRLELGDSFTISFELNCDFLDELPSLTINLSTDDGTPILMTSSFYKNEESKGSAGARQITISCEIPRYLLNEGVFVISKLIVFKGASNVLLEIHDLFSFEVFFNPTSIFGLEGRRQGMIRPMFNWNYEI